MNMHSNTHEATPDRVVVNNVFRTPVNPKPCLWSPILHAVTPDLNAPDFEGEGTPALIRSLGINPELNVSWSANMETPTQTQMSLPAKSQEIFFQKMVDSPKRSAEFVHYQ